MSFFCQIILIQSFARDSFQEYVFYRLNCDSFLLLSLFSVVVVVVCFEAGSHFVVQALAVFLPHLSECWIIGVSHHVSLRVKYCKRCLCLCVCSFPFLMRSIFIDCTALTLATSVFGLLSSIPCASSNLERVCRPELYCFSCCRARIPGGSSVRKERSSWAPRGRIHHGGEAWQQQCGRECPLCDHQRTALQS